MVALLVIAFIVACLLVDLFVIQARKKREQQQVAPAVMMPAGGLVFAQDGGLPVDSEKAKTETSGDEKEANDESTAG